MTQDEFLAEAKARFREKARNRKFVCPMCGTVQSVQQLLDAVIASGGTKDDVHRYIGFSCIGCGLTVGMSDSRPENDFMSTENSVTTGRMDEAESGSAVRLHPVVMRLRLQLAHMVNRADYVCAHRYGPSDPVGTRLVAIQDLATETQRARELLIETQTPEDAGWACNACGTVYETEAEAAGCPCPMHSHARTKLP